MKPVLRWTIGDVSSQGFEVLKYSIKKIREIYCDEFDLFVCYNNIEESRIRFAKDYGAVLMLQNPLSIPVPPTGVAWKLYPPRIALDTHEIFIDNDLVILKMLPEIDEFINSQDAVIYTEGLHGLYGRYKKNVVLSPHLNSGLFGVPPYFDLYKKIVKEIKPWSDYFDEQGLIASIFSGQPHKICIKASAIAVCDKNSNNLPHFTHGCHFCGANQDNTAWKFFLKKNLPLL